MNRIIAVAVVVLAVFAGVVSANSEVVEPTADHWVDVGDVSNNPHDYVEVTIKGRPSFNFYGCTGSPTNPNLPDRGNGIHSYDIVLRQHGDHCQVGFNPAA